MSFNIALSGVSAAQRDLDTTANNIANVNTVGFKESRAEFGDVYASSLLGGGRTKVGDGVLTQDVAQQFSQGSLQFTNTALDLAITGTGFFVTVPDTTSQDFTYTRAGQFKLNESNQVVNSQGDNLLGFPVNPTDGTSNSISLSTASAVTIPDSAGQPQPTAEVDLKMNLPAGEIGLDVSRFDPDDPNTFHSSTSVTTYDSLGDSHIQTFYFIRQLDTSVTPNATTNNWSVVSAVDGTLVNYTDSNGVSVSSPATNRVGHQSSNTTVNNGGLGIAAGVLQFNSSGEFDNMLSPDNIQAVNNATTPPTINFSTFTTEPLGGVFGAGPDPLQQIRTNFNLDVEGEEPTQFASSFEVTALDQDGLPVGRLTGIDIGPDGLVRATFSNGTSEAISRIALARFANEQGLTQVGNASWKESILSGESLAGEATTGTFGTINSSALEQSNVNLTTELIDMIIAQRNFQANSRALEINNQLNQTILGIR